jgi:hypothetical protein
MIGAFPDLYPDEMLVSAWARYEAWVRYPGRQALLEELFGYGKTDVAFDLPRRLGYFAAALPPGHAAASVEYLISEYTLLPYYAAFLPAERRAAVFDQMGARQGGSIHSLLGINRVAMWLPERLRYCPVCTTEDRERFGETYWHRIHQAAGVAVCPQHTMWLETTDVPMWIVHGPVTFTTAESVVASVVPQPLNLDRLPERQLLRLAQAVRWLLAHPEVCAETFRLKERGLLQLATQGLATYSGDLKQREIMAAVETTFSTEMLTQIGCAWTPQKAERCWVRRLWHNNNRTTFVLYFLLLILFYAEDIPTFLALPAELKPFGEGPWPCLNPACEHDGERCIAVYELDYNAKGFPRGTFACRACGFVYSRVGPDTQPHDLYRIGEVKERGLMWEVRLRQLWFDPEVTIRQMVPAMRSSWGHLRWQGTRLGLPFPPPGVRGRQRTKTPAPMRTRGVSPDPTAHREQWLKVVQQNPELDADRLRQQASRIHSWLRYHDREWLLRNTPRKQRAPRRLDVDWKQRDVELVAEIQQGYQRLMSRQESLFRVTATAILTAIRRRGYYTGNRHRLPRSVDKLHQLAESYEDFAIRRVWHFASAFHAKGQVPRRRVIAERASVDDLPHRDNPRVQAAVDEALAWLRGE